MFRKPLVWSILGGLSLAFATPAMAQNRVTANQKGSLLIFSKVEIRWSADGRTLISDTFLDMSNDADSDGVDVQAYFINGDLELEEECIGDPCTEIVQTFEPGWNTADCRFHLTKNQPHYWSAAHGSNKCQSFSVLDMDGPGRLDKEDGNRTRILRGYVVMWAVAFNSEAGENGEWQEIRWNHLKGDTLILNYVEGTAWEYNAWAFQARCPSGRTNVNGCFLDGPGYLDMDGGEYDYAFGQLLLDFYASGSTALSGGGVTVNLDTELTLHSVDADLRQDNDGPPLTKADINVCNENESCFSGTKRCICCWDSKNLSSYVADAGIPNHFLRSKLGTDKGAARIEGNYSDDCKCKDICGTRHCDNDDHALLGVAVKRLTFSGGDVATAGMNLVGMETESAQIRVDTPEGSGELRDGGARTSFSRGSDKAGSGKGGSTGRDSESRGTGETRGE
jgi:hypothetical protein